ncbi:MAG: VWA domain-containing protein [Patescibacteria group bacterium]|jgi:Ca-activated chloride channel family protein
MEIRTKLSKDQYSFNKDSETHLLVELTAPQVKIENRPPICVVPVLDVSGSMSGSKIDYLRKACRKLIDHLAPGDFVGVVAFDSMVYEVAPIREITQEQKEIIKKKISELNAGSATNLSGGLIKALEWINAMDLPVETVLRVIIFTDGQANVGLNGKNLLNMAVEKKQRVSVSTFGFGTDCHQDFLAEVSSRCDGNYAFIDSADAALSAFGRELGGLMSTYAQDIKVSITPDKNNSIVEILNDEDVEEKDGSAIIKLRDILGEEKKWLVAKVKLSEVDKPLPRKVNAFTVNVKFTDRNGAEKVLDSVPVKVKFCKSDEEPKEEDTEVVKHRDRLLAAKAQDQADAFVKVGNYQAAYSVMNLCCDSLSDENIKGAVRGITANYADARSYSATSGINSMAKKAFMGRRVSYVSKDCESICDIADVQSNSIAEEMATNFSEDDEKDSGASVSWTTGDISGISTGSSVNITTGTTTGGESGSSITYTSATRNVVARIGKRRL